MAWQSARAEDFTWFTVKDFQGWVEKTPTGNQIKLLPFIGIPNTRYWLTNGAYNTFTASSVANSPGIEFTFDGKLKFGYTIINDTKHLPPLFLRDVELAIGEAPNSLTSATVSFVNASFSKVELEIAGKVADSESFDTQYATGNRTGFFYFDASNSQLVNQLRTGDFQYELTMNYPLATFSSLDLTLDADIVSNSWVKATKKIINKKRKTGFSIGPINFGSNIRNTYAEEKTQSNSKTNISNRTTIVMRDATEEQQQLLDRLLGLATTNLQEARKMHTAAAAAAVLINKPTLAEAHKLYAAELKSAAPSAGDFTKDLLDHISKLKDADLLSFYAAGFKSTVDSTSSFYRYDASLFTSVETSLNQKFSSIVINNSAVTAVSRTIPEKSSGQFVEFARADRAAEARIFNLNVGANLLGPIWVKGVASALEQGRESDVKYAFQRRYLTSRTYKIDVNFPINQNGDTILHEAAQSAAPAEIIEFMLRRGADPNKENIFGEHPRDLTSNPDIIGIFDHHKNDFGEVVIEIDHPTDIDIISAEYPSYLSKSEKVEIFNNHPGSSDLIIGGYPTFVHEVPMLVYQAKIPNNQLQILQFPYQLVSQNWTHSIIRGQVTFSGAYRLELGKRKSVDKKTFTFGGPQNGFILVDPN